MRQSDFARVIREKLMAPPRLRADAGAGGLPHPRPVPATPRFKIWFWERTRRIGATISFLKDGKWTADVQMARVGDRLVYAEKEDTYFKIVASNGVAPRGRWLDDIWWMDQKVSLSRAAAKALCVWVTGTRGEISFGGKQKNITDRWSGYVPKGAALSGDLYVTSRRFDPPARGLVHGIFVDWAVSVSDVDEELGDYKLTLTKDGVSCLASCSAWPGDAAFGDDCYGATTEVSFSGPDRAPRAAVPPGTIIQDTGLVSTHMTYFSLVGADPNDHVQAWWAGEDLYVTVAQFHLYCRPVLIHTDAPAGVLPTIKVCIKKAEEDTCDWELRWLPNSTKLSACAKQVQSGNLLVDLPCRVMYDVCPLRVVPRGTREIRVKIAAGNSMTPTCYLLNNVNVKMSTKEGYAVCDAAQLIGQTVYFDASSSEPEFLGALGAAWAAPDHEQ